MSTAAINQPLSSPGPYIGSRRGRNFLANVLKPPFSSSNGSTSTPSSSGLFRSSQFETENNIARTQLEDNLQIQEEERPTSNYFPSTIPLDEKQSYLQEDRKLNGFLSPSTSSSSSLSFFPTTHNVTPVSVSNHHSPSSFTQEKQYFYQPSRPYEHQSYRQPLHIEEENKHFEKLEKSNQQNEERQKQSYENLVSNHYQHLGLGDDALGNGSLTSKHTLDSISEEKTSNDTQASLFTAKPALSSTTSHSPTVRKKVIDPSLSQNNNNTKPSSLSVDSRIDRLFNQSTNGLTTNQYRTIDPYQLNKMSTLRQSSNIGTTPISSRLYDHQITDEGNKYIIQLKTDEYQQEEFTITPRYSSNQLVIEAKHREEDSLGGYICRELRKIFNIPTHIDMDHYAYSYDNRSQELSVEMPYKKSSSNIYNKTTDSAFLSPSRTTTEPSLFSQGNFDRSTIGSMMPMNSNRLNGYNDSKNSIGAGTTSNESKSFRTSTTAGASSLGATKPFDFDLFHRSAFRPEIVRTTSNDKNNDKKLTMSLDLGDYQAEDIKVSVKDRELIVQAERKIETDTRKSRTSFYQSTSLPPQTDIENLRSHFLDGKLYIEAPYRDANAIDRNMTTSSSFITNQGHNW